MKDPNITDAEFEAIVSTWEPELAACVRSQRQQLTEQGVTSEPLRTRMACEFADVIMANRAAARLTPDWPECDARCGPGHLPPGAKCHEPATHTCACSRCAIEPYDAERFHACFGHLEQVAVGHERVRGRSVEWRKR